MGKLTISMAIFHSFLYVYQAGYQDKNTPIGRFLWSQLTARSVGAPPCCGGSLPLPRPPKSSTRPAAGHEAVRRGGGVPPGVGDSL